MVNSKTITNANETAIITSLGTLTINNGTIIGTYVTKVPTIYVSENSELNLSKVIVGK